MNFKEFIHEMVDPDDPLMASKEPYVALFVFTVKDGVGKWQLRKIYESTSEKETFAHEIGIPPSLGSRIRNPRQQAIAQARIAVVEERDTYASAVVFLYYRGTHMIASNIHHFVIATSYRGKKGKKNISQVGGTHPGYSGWLWSSPVTEHEIGRMVARMVEKFNLASARPNLYDIFFKRDDVIHSVWEGQIKSWTWFLVLTDRGWRVGNLNGKPAKTMNQNVDSITRTLARNYPLVAVVQWYKRWDVRDLVYNVRGIPQFVFAPSTRHNFNDLVDYIYSLDFSSQVKGDANLFALQEEVRQDIIWGAILMAHDEGILGHA